MKKIKRKISRSSSSLWKFLLVFLEINFLSNFFSSTIIIDVNCQFAENSPPSMYFDRRWIIAASQSVGSQIVQVHGSDQESKSTNLTFGLEKIDIDQQPLPFEINSKTGSVYVNASLAQWAGQNLRLYVTLTDGQLTTKAEAYVTIQKNDSSTEDDHHVTKSWLNLFPPPPRQENRPKLATWSPPKIDEGTTTQKSSTKNSSTIHAEKEKEEEEEEEGGEKQNVDDAPIGAIFGIVGGVTVIIVVIALLMGVAVRHKRRVTELSKSEKVKSAASKSTIDGLNDTWRGPIAPNNRYESDNLPNSMHELTDNTPPSPPPPPTGDRWEFPRHHLKFFSILGEGAFGQVWRCEAKSCHFFDTSTLSNQLDSSQPNDSSVVAVKTLKESANAREKSDLMTELAIMKSIAPHPNVIRLLGCCTEKEPIFLIMEFMSLGKLQSHLRNSRAELQHNHSNAQSHTLTSRDLTSYCHQVAKGMDYLTTRHGIIHRDLAARNVLINDSHCCKVADFGFARDVMTSHVYERKSEGRLPIRWMAPESLYDNLFSVKSDVWSFGILMWEVVTLGSTPYPGMSAADVMRRVREGFRLEKPEHCRRELYNIMFYCWDRVAEQRPTFEECAQFLEKLILTETDYIELERFPDHSYYNIIMSSLGGVDGEKL